MNNSIAHDIAIKLIGMLTTILGSILNPLVSSSKNLIKPPLEAGSGADFLLLLMVNSQDHYFDINTFLSSFYFIHSINEGIDRF